MRFLIILALLVLGNSTLSAQCPGTSPFWGLNCFLNSDFIIKFEEMRTRAEQSVHDFKRLAALEDFSEAELQAVRDAYNASANQFNDILYRIKDDLLDRHKRKFLVRYPDDYALQIEAELSKASNFYSETYARTITELTGGRVQTISFLTLLPELIKYGKMAVALFQKVKKEIRKYNEKLFDQYLIEAYRFHSWDEIN